MIIATLLAEISSQITIDYDKITLFKKGIFVEKKEAACAERIVEVTAGDLPLCCPQHDQIVWSAHPRIYLDIQDRGHIICPYCSTKYILK